MKLFKIIVYLTLLHFAQSNAETTQIDSALSVLSKQKNDSNKVNTLNFLCWNYSDLGENEKSIYYAKEAIKIADEINFKKGARFAYNELGANYINKADYIKALENLKIARQLAFELNDSVHAAITLANIANVYNNQSKYKYALENYLAAVKIFEKNNIQYAMATTYNNIGTIYMDHKEFENAKSYFQKAIIINKQLENGPGLADALANFGSINYDVKNMDIALKHFEEALVIYKKLENDFKSGIVLGNIGRLFQFKGQYKEASVAFNEATNIFRKLDAKGELWKSLLNQGYVYVEMKNYTDAKKLVIEGIQISKQIDHIDNLRATYKLLSEIEEGLGNFSNALKYHKLYKHLTDSIFSIENSKQLSSLKTEFEVKKKEQELKAANKIEQAKKDAQIQKQKTIRNGFIIGLILTLALAFTIYRSYLQKEKSNKLISKQKQEVEQQKEIVEHQNEEILASITYAKRIQSTILPPQKVVKSYLDNSFILYLPKDIVAGDFYWMETVQLADEQISGLANENKINNNQLILFAACDCTGHGVPGALVSVVCSNALNRVVKEYKIFEPAAILDKVVEIVVKDFSKDENENVQDGMDISFCALNKEKGILYWAGANNPLWIIRNGNLIEYKADKQPVGKYEGIKPFTNHEINLEKDDLIYLFTDGFADQFGGEKNKKLTKARFKELLLSIHQMKVDEQRNQLYNFLNKYRGGNEQVDDILVIGVKV
ncbi:MAG TPA: tetratricopeptide repeat protein [Bacteroidia bacterium]|nr:tetratricopeptide repeat protein [Bacteroidia bacterium]